MLIPRHLRFSPIEPSTFGRVLTGWRIGDPLYARLVRGLISSSGMRGDQ